MQLSIYHETLYQYAAPAHHSIQVLRLTPRSDPLQRILNWNIQAPTRLWADEDAYGNRCHTLVISKPHTNISVVASGVVEVNAPAQDGVLPRRDERLSPLAFLTPTRLTSQTPALASFAKDHLPSRADSIGDLISLANAIADVVDYRTGVTETHTPAGEALEHGYGVCQDHAHLFIACCRLRGVPARYVSGYVEVGESTHAASHAWADAWLPDIGWVSVDTTHRVLVTDHHCRLAIGRDFDSASPIRGVRTGGGNESLKVTVSVDADQ